jgi:hypothetical protein
MNNPCLRVDAQEEYGLPGIEVEELEVELKLDAELFYPTRYRDEAQAIDRVRDTMWIKQKIDSWMAKPENQQRLFNFIMRESANDREKAQHYPG